MVLALPNGVRPTMLLVPPRRARRIVVQMISVCAIIATAACSSANDIVVEPLPDEIPPVANPPVVMVDDNLFAPEVLTVTAGTTVRWEWQGRAAHDVVGPGFDSGVMLTGHFEQTLTETGSHPYVCTLHPRMTGVVHVVESR